MIATPGASPPVPDCATVLDRAAHLLDQAADTGARVADGWADYCRLIQEARARREQRGRR